MTDETPMNAARRTGLHRCAADACDQGRRDCPCPSECGLPLSDDDELGPIARAIVIAVTVLAVLGAVSPILFF